MNLIIQALVGVLIFNFIWAIYTTFKKEKIMIDQGEGSLPSSTYAFITVRNSARIALYILLLYYLPETIELIILDPETSWVWVIILFLGFSLLIELVSTLVEALTRYVYMNIEYRKANKEQQEAN